MQNLMVFEGHDVEVFELNGQVLFNPYHVAEILDIKNVRDNIARMNAKQVVKLTNSKVGKTDFRKLHNTGENFLTESGVYKLVFKSHKPNAEAFTDSPQNWFLRDAKTGQAQEGETAFRKHDGKEHQGGSARCRSGFQVHSCRSGADLFRLRLSGQYSGDFRCSKAMGLHIYCQRTWNFI